MWVVRLVLYTVTRDSNESRLFWLCCWKCKAVGCNLHLSLNRLPCTFNAKPVRMLKCYSEIYNISYIMKMKSAYLLTFNLSRTVQVAVWNWSCNWFVLLTDIMSQFCSFFIFVHCFVYSFWGFFGTWLSSEWLL